MLNLFKKALLLGLGTTILVEETVERAANNLIKTGKATTKDARKMAKDLVDEAKKEIESVHQKGIKQVEKVFADFHVTTRKEYEALEKRVKDLEKAYKGTK